MKVATSLACDRGCAAGPSGRPHAVSSGRSLAARAPQPPRPSRLRRGGSTVARATAGPPTDPSPPFGPLTAAALFASGATLGTALDGIHTNVSLLQYDYGHIQLGLLSTSAIVPPLLGTFYVVLGFLHGLLSSSGGGGGGRETGEGDADAAAAARRELAVAAAAFGALAVNLEVSAALFRSGAPSATTAAALLPLALANWAAFERTPGGGGGGGGVVSAPALRVFALAAFCGAAAPYFELPLLSPAAFGLPYPSLWHYTSPDWFPAGAAFGGMNAFVPLCYFAYVPAVGRLRRALGLIEAALQQRRQ